MSFQDATVACMTETHQKKAHCDISSSTKAHYDKKLTVTKAHRLQLTVTKTHWTIGNFLIDIFNYWLSMFWRFLLWGIKLMGVKCATWGTIDTLSMGHFLNQLRFYER